MPVRFTMELRVEHLGPRRYGDVERGPRVSPTTSRLLTHRFLSGWFVAICVVASCLAGPVLPAAGDVAPGGGIQVLTPGYSFGPANRVLDTRRGPPLGAHKTLSVSLTLLLFFDSSDGHWCVCQPHGDRRPKVGIPHRFSDRSTAAASFLDQFRRLPVVLEPDSGQDGSWRQSIHLQRLGRAG